MRVKNDAKSTPRQRERRMKGREGARPSPMVDMASPKEPMRTTGRRPILSGV